MGTSLTGTKPKDTYDSLIKVGDNGPISGTAKYLSDGLGNDLPIAVSTSNVGIGTSSPQQKLHIGNVAANSYALLGTSIAWGAADTNRIKIGSTGDTFSLGCDLRANTNYAATTETSLGLWVTNGSSTMVEVVRATQNGLTFNGDTAAANALDDYEEGTFTPQFGTGGDTSGMVYATQLGEYTKIGNLVNIRIAITLTTLGGSAGNAYIYNLPFTNGSSVSVIGSASIFNATALMDNVTFLIDGSANYISLLKNNSFSGISKADLTNTTVIFFNASYRV